MLPLSVCLDGCKQLTTAAGREVLRAGTGKSGCKSADELRLLGKIKILEGTLKLPAKFTTLKHEFIAGAFDVKETRQVAVEKLLKAQNSPRWLISGELCM